MYLVNIFLFIQLTTFVIFFLVFNLIILGSASPIENTTFCFWGFGVGSGFFFLLLYVDQAGAKVRSYFKSLSKQDIALKENKPKRWLVDKAIIALSSLIIGNYFMAIKSWNLSEFYCSSAVGFGFIVYFTYMLFLMLFNLKILRSN